MKKESSMISSLAMEQPPRSGATKGPMPSNMPGKMKGDKMPHEVLNDKMAKGLGC